MKFHRLWTPLTQHISTAADDIAVLCSNNIKQGHQIISAQILTFGNACRGLITYQINDNPVPRDNVLVVKDITKTCPSPDDCASIFEDRYEEIMKSNGKIIMAQILPGYDIQFGSLYEGVLIYGYGY